MALAPLVLGRRRGAASQSFTWSSSVVRCRYPASTTMTTSTCARCGAPRTEPGACRYCGALADERVGRVVAEADLRTGSLRGVVHSGSMSFRAETWGASQWGGGLMVESFKGLGPLAATIVATEGSFADVDVELTVILAPPRSELALKLRHGDAGNYNFRLAHDGVTGIERLVRTSRGPSLSWLAQGKLASYASRRRDVPSVVRASAIGTRLTMHVDGQLVLTADDGAVANGRVSVCMTVLTAESSSLLLSTLEVRAL